MKEFISRGMYLSLHALGYDSFTTLLDQLLIIKNKTFAVSVFFLSIGGGFFVWIEQWIFSPGTTYLVFVALTVSESIFGTIKSLWYNKNKFQIDKSARIIPKLIAHTFALSAAWHLANADPLLGWMPSTIFIYFSTQNFLKSILHMIDMKWMDGNFADFIRGKFTMNNLEHEKKN
jgi:hypothetical protein